MVNKLFYTIILIIMKKFWNLYIDDFMMEKEVSQWVGMRMIGAYRTIFNLFTKSKQIIATDLSSYTTPNFKRFLGENLTEKNWSSSTYNNYRKYLRCYCEYLKNEWYIDENPIDKILKRKVAVQLPKTLTKDEIQELLRKLSTIFDTKTYTWKRNETIVYTYLYTGLRLSELLNLQLNHLQIHEWYIKVLKWKWSKDRIIPISNDLSRRLAHFIQMRNKDFDMQWDSALFPTAYGNFLQPWDMKAIINKLRENISFYFTWHQLRHTFATELVRNNFDIFNISRILGHSKIDTTKIYLSVDTGRLKKQLDNITLFA